MVDGDGGDLDPVGDIRHVLPKLNLENNTVTDVRVNVGDVAYLPCRFPQLSTLHQVSHLVGDEGVGVRVGGLGGRKEELGQGGRWRGLGWREMDRYVVFLIVDLVSVTVMGIIILIMIVILSYHCCYHYYDYYYLIRRKNDYRGMKQAREIGYHAKSCQILLYVCNLI